MQIGSTKLSANKRIKQHVQVIQEYEKEQALLKLLTDIWDKIPTPEANREMERTIIFTNKKYVCENLLNSLYEQNWTAATIHGDKAQSERDRALNDFKSGRAPILIATDVAVRIFINFRLGD